MSKENTTGILERWSKVFDQNETPKVSRTLPYRRLPQRAESLELEDVFEEVKEEVHSIGSRYLPSTESTQKPSPRRKSIEHVRPNTPGRSGLNRSLSTLDTKPSWQSSTKVFKQNKYDHNSIQSYDGRPRKDISPRKQGNHAKCSTSDTDLSKSSKVVTTMKPVTVIPEKPAVLKVVVHGGEPISPTTAKELRQVVFGSALLSFNLDWRSQHINFLGNSSYGLSFYKPGPCGVLACIQAFLMKYLLYFHKTSDTTDSRILEPLSSERQQALVSAMARIIFQAGNDSHAVVVLPCGTCKWTTDEEYRKDDLTENLDLFKFNNLTELEKFLKRHLSFFDNTSGNGCVIFLYSVILSRTVEGVINDMCNPSATLMGHGEACSQAIINLLLTGRAVSKVFNGNIEFDKRGNPLPLPLKGIKTRSEIGFLTINEHFRPKEIQVGSMLKTPKYPVWVVDSSSGRYCVVFCLNSELVNDWRLERRFNLHLYSGTTKYSSSLDEIITVDTRDIVDESGITENTRPIDHCLRTKWPGAVIE